MTTNYKDLKCSLDSLQEEIIKNFSESPLVSGPVSFLGEENFDESKDLLITRYQPNQSNGIGILLSRVFNPKTCINIKVTNDFLDKGCGSFQSYRIDPENQSRSAIFQSVINVLASKNIKRIVCSPCHEEEYLMGIVTKYFLDVPMAVWVMDHYFSVEDKIAAELFSIADIVFVISPEMRDFYEKKFQRKFYVLPPTGDASSIKSPCQIDVSHEFSEKICVMVGHIFIPYLIEDLVRTIHNSGWMIHWYNSDPPSEELRAYGIIKKGFLPEEEFQELSKKYPFAVMSIGTENRYHQQEGVTLFSLSSRIVSLMATAQIPILVIGSQKGCVANFVRNFGIGLTIESDEKQFLAAVEKLSDREFRAHCSQNAAKYAGNFSDKGLEEWIWKSCASREPIDDRFEKLFRRQPGNYVPYQDDPIPSDLEEWLQMVYCSLKRLAQLEYQPDFVIDVGAAFGGWSAMAQRIFPRARFILVEPLSQHYSQGCHWQYPQFEWICAAAANETGNTTFQMSHDLLGSSLLYPKDERTYQSIEVPTVTLDTILVEKAIYGRGILKIDVQYAEHLVLAGAVHLLEKVDIVILELTLRSGPAGSKKFLEMIHQMESLGFQYFDDAGVWRCPIVGTLQEKDVLFMRSTMLERFGN